MGIYDRYLLWMFIKYYLMCFFGLIGLYVVFDMFANLDDFLQFAKSTPALLKLLAEYYGYRTIYFFPSFSGIIALIAATFVLVRVQTSNELTAILAAGISMRRLVFPLILATAGTAAAAVVVREQVMPQVRNKLSLSPQDLRGSGGRPVVPRYDLETDVLLQGQESFALQRRISDPNFILPTALAGKSTVLAAREAFYHEPTVDRPGGYLLCGVTDPVGFTTRKSLILNSAAGMRSVVLTPVDHAWLKSDECFVVSQVKFDLWTAADAWRMFSSTRELIETIHSPSLDYGSNIRVAVHARILQPFLDVLLLFLGLPFVATKTNRNVFVAFALCFGVVVAFLGIGMVCQWMGNASLTSPYFAAWLPVLIFTPAAAWLSTPMLR